MPERLRVPSERSPGPKPWACENDARQALVQVARAMPSGPADVSARWRRSGAEGFLIAAQAAGRPTTADSVAWLPLQAGKLPAGEAGSDGSSPAPAQWRLHRDLYRQRPEVACIVRSRPPFSTTLACIARVQETGVPAFHPDLVLAAGGTLRCAASFEDVAGALADRAACLIADRGLLSTGATLQAAAERAFEIEALAQVYWQVSLLNGAPV